MVLIAPQFCCLYSLSSGRSHFNSAVFTASRAFTSQKWRSLGIQPLVYMDNMLLMASFKQKQLDHIQMTMFLPENLGFIINSKKIYMYPDPSPRNRISGNDGKFSNYGTEIAREDQEIRQEAHHLLFVQQPSVQLLSQLLGKLNATTPALQMTTLFCCSLQICLKQALSANQQNVVQLSL